MKIASLLSHIILVLVIARSRSLIIDKFVPTTTMKPGSDAEHKINKMVTNVFTDYCNRNPSSCDIMRAKLLSMDKRRLGKMTKLMNMMQFKNLERRSISSFRKRNQPKFQQKKLLSKNLSTRKRLLIKKLKKFIGQ